MTTRRGKIARLPRWVRDELNTRLADGETGPRLVEWLNGLPRVREALECGFGGRAITEQNLSEWRQGGYEDWLRELETCDQMRDLMEKSQALDEAADGHELSDDLARVLTAELAQVVKEVITDTTDPKEKLALLRQTLQELTPLRRSDHRAARLRRDQQLWEEEADRAAEKKIQDERREARREFVKPVYAAMRAKNLAEVLGGGENGWKVASFVTEVIEDLPNGSLGEWKNPAKPPPAAPQDANPPDQTKSQ